MEFVTNLIKQPIKDAFGPVGRVKHQEQNKQVCICEFAEASSSATLDGGSEVHVIPRVLAEDLVRRGAVMKID